jgi:hypothetical protein
MDDAKSVHVLDLPGASWITIDIKNYHRCEKEVINPFLESIGMTVLDGWFTLDGDSAGPLIRCVRVRHWNGLIGEVFYG